MEHTTSSLWVKGLVDMFASQGVDATRLFTALRLDIRLLDESDARFTIQEVSKMWDLAVAWSGKPALGLDPDLAARFVNFDAVNHVMMAYPKLRTSLEKLAAYLAVISSALVFTLEPEGDDFWLALGYVGTAPHGPRQRQEYSLLALLTLCRWLVRRNLCALAAEFCGATPANAQPYHRAFGCPLRFDSPVDRILLSAADLDAAIPSHSDSMLAVHERMINDRLTRLGNASTSLQVRQQVILLLPKGEPRREDIARNLALSDRTMRRKLLAENTSFQQLLDDVRRELAEKLLLDMHLPLAEIPCRLGFADQSNFFRACKRWFGATPGQLRKTLSVRGIAPP